MSDYNDTPDDELDAEIAAAAAAQAESGMVKIGKGGEINLTRVDPTLREITLGVGWDLRQFEGDPIDVDASIFLLDRNDLTKEDEDFIFYNNLSTQNGSVRHLGDSRTGAGDGDDEQIIVDLYNLSFDVIKIAVVLSIYDQEVTKANFTKVRNVYFRIVNNETKHETFRFELDKDIGSSTGLYIGYMERIGSDWIFKALGEPIPGGLQGIATQFGMIIAEAM